MFIENQGPTKPGMISFLQTNVSCNEPIIQNIAIHKT